MSKFKDRYEWDAEKGVATCILTVGDDEFIGKAYCHPEDEDMSTKMTGFSIAFMRAEIKSYKQKKKDMKIALSAYVHLYSTMSRSKKFNRWSYEGVMLKRKIKQCEAELAALTSKIADLESDLQWYIDEKEKFFNKLRKFRKNQTLDNVE